MKLFLIVGSLLLSLPLISQTRLITAIVMDSESKTPLQNATGEIKDSCANQIQVDTTTSAGIFHFTINKNCGTYFLKVKHDQVDCDGGSYWNYTEKIISSFVPDTVRIFLNRFWVDYKTPALEFKDNSFYFKDDYDSTGYCNLLFPDTACVAFRPLNWFASLYPCNHFTQVEIRSYYVKSEAKSSGDSLAKERCKLIIEYLHKRGIPENVSFVIKTYQYQKRPIRGNDGTFLPEFDLVTFSIMAY